MQVVFIRTERVFKFTITQKAVVDENACLPLADRFVHKHGRKFMPAETLNRIVGTPKIEVGPYVKYLKEKFGEIYAF